MDTILENLRKTSLREKIEKAQDTAEKPEALNGIYRCRVCGYIFNEAEEGKPFSSLKECPLCHVGPHGFMRVG